jgi:hypothetical protein
MPNTRFSFVLNFCGPKVMVNWQEKRETGWWQSGEVFCFCQQLQGEFGMGINSFAFAKHKGTFPPRHSVLLKLDCHGAWCTNDDHTWKGMDIIHRKTLLITGLKKDTASLVKLDTCIKDTGQIRPAYRKRCVPCLFHSGQSCTDDQGSPPSPLQCCVMWGLPSSLVQTCLG